MVGTFNQSLQCTQDVFVGFQAPLPPVCTQIPCILVTTCQSHHSPLSILYSADPLVDPKTHIGTGIIELFFVMILMTPYAYECMSYV